MNCLKNIQNKKKRETLRYFVYGIAFFFVLIVSAFLPQNVKAIDVEVHNSNYSGNNGSKDAKTIGTGNSTRYFIQGTSKAKKDVVAFTIKNFFTDAQGSTTKYDRIAVGESGYVSSSVNKDYDTYAYDVLGEDTRDIWSSDNGNNRTGEKGFVMGENCAATFNASLNLLVANGGSEGYVSLFCRDNNDLKYAYTLRAPGYGLKTIHIYYYDTSKTEATVVGDLDINIVVSKPISEFNDSVVDGFTWLQKEPQSESDTKCPASHRQEASEDVTATNEICVYYDNSGNYNEERTLQIEIPKEVAYNHAPATDLSLESNITGSTIYAINTFRNNGSSKYVKYYYYNFIFDALRKNEDMNEEESYHLEIKIDARGNYVFYLKDLFGNTFVSIAEGNSSDSAIVAGTDPDIVAITNISIRNLLIDYTNSDVLTILKAVTELVNNDEFGGEIAEIHYDEALQIMYANLQKDTAKIILEAFSKILIKNGKSFCTYGRCTADSTIEEIKKETLKNDEIAETKYWTVDWKASYEKSDAEVSENATTVTRETYKQGNSFLNKEYNVDGHFNRLEITVSNNARYRFYIRDIYGNNTGKDIDEDSTADDFLINPYVDVTVIDSTTPELESALDGANNTSKGATTTIYSYDYVIGGGRNQTELIDLIENPDLQDIYYNSKGGKYFDYEDAIRIAQISAYDRTTINAYAIQFLSGYVRSSKDNTPQKSSDATDGKYIDPSSLLKSDRNTSNSSTTITIDGSALNLHDSILKNGIMSFTGGLVVPITTALIENNKFTIDGTEYTINYQNDKPITLSGGIAIENGRTFNIGSTKYIISGSRIVTYVENNLAKVQVAETKYTISADDTYLNYITNDGVEKTFVTGLDSAYHYTGAYVGFLKITFKEINGGNEICSVGLDSTDNMNCFKEINKYIDTVRSFDMVFDVTDYVGHEAAPYTVTVNVEDNTAPGFLPEFVRRGKDSENNEIWTNVFNDSSCMLEIGNVLQKKSVLIDCYLLGDGVSGSQTGGTYHFVDNDTTYTNDPEKQWYVEDGKTNYFDSIKLEIEKDDGNLTEVTESTNILLNRAREHKFVVTIFDNWSNNKSGETNNSLKIQMTYYVNPRTLLIEPISNQKTYGSQDPVFEYCVYINKDISTFSQSSRFFDKDFLEAYFKLAYCTSGVERESGYAEITNVHNLTNILLNGNAFTGNLSRVEDAWYNKYNNSIDDIQNNYVGYYNIVLGTLAIDKTTANDGAACKTSQDYTCDQDYVVKIHPKFLIDDVTSYDTYANNQIVGTRQVTQVKEVANEYRNFVNGKVQSQNKDPELNDEPLTESKVKFMIKQSILTITANGGSKIYGEQDSNSHNWNVNGTNVNSTKSSGYLNGYTIVGLQYNTDLYYYDTNATTASKTITTPSDIIQGVLRREIGENAGKYMICNIKNSNPSLSFGALTPCDGNYNAVHANQYSTETGKEFMFAAFDLYGVGGESDTAALVVRTNGDIYGTSTDTAGHSLHNDNRNYVINYVSAYYFIKTGNMIIQPGVNQGKEYAATPYMDPVWQLVVYGETVNCANVTTCTSNISKDDSGFTGYTTDFDTYSYSELSINNYRGNNVTSGKSPDTEIYYGRRKTSPDVTYEYQMYYNLTTSGGKYTNVYLKNGNYYYLDIELADTNTNWSDRYVYAYGTYHPITNVDTASKRITITITGHLVNQTYTLFGSGSDANFAEGQAYLTREEGETVNWYTFTGINNASTNFRVNVNGRSQCIVGTDGTISEDGTGNCRNYNLWFENSAPDVYKNASGDNIDIAGSEPELNFDMTTIAKIITIKDTTNEYRPDGKNGCYTHSDAYTKQCDNADKDQVLFEIFKREIVISFDANRYTFIYGHRYDYYDGGSSYVNNEVGYNSKSGIFKIRNGDANGQNSSEGDIFVCYDENKVAARCTNNPNDPVTYDYGVTRGNTWTDIGLEFYMHPAISDINSAFYREYMASEGNYSTRGFAIPAGTYFVYADISTAAKENYKFTYLGGSLTIKPKTTSIQLTSYTMEYGETSYYSYGLGSNYSEFTAYSNRCMQDTNYTRDTGLITGCGSEGNEVGNTYGFTVEGLDYRDTIANSFSGSPLRTAGTAVNYYKIGVGNIQAITNSRGISNSAGSSTTCTAITNNPNFTTACAIYETLDVKNYDIEYSLTNNEGAYLFITPASINIQVTTGQTKMYGCAYSYFNTTSEYPYTIANGYTNCDESRKNPSDDIAYQYTVTGDKDYTQATSYTVSKTADQGDGEEIPESSSLEGSLYRVDHTSDYVDYKTMYNNSKNNIYQGQSVGKYIITLGDLNAKTNGASTCDVFNNPSVDGTLPCRNFNINYYGNSAAGHYDANGNITTEIEEKHEDHVQHKYSIASNISTASLKTYDLNYVEDTAGNYYYINGKYVASSEISTFANYYVSVASLPKYKLKNGYVYDGYLYVESSTGTYYRNGNSFALASGANIASTTLRYEQVSVVQTDADRYELLTDGEQANLSEKVYVNINSKYVSLDSLVKYNRLASGEYVADTNGSYVLVYGETANGGLTRYKLDINNMYKVATGNTGAYVFVNGSYVLKTSAIALNNNSWATEISANSAMVLDGTSVTNGIVVGNKFYGGSVNSSKTSSTDIADVAVAEATVFNITRRDVHVHTEYNVKYVGNEDLIDVITCEQIFAAYGLGSDYSQAGNIRSSYCDAAGTKLILGKSRYYAVDNSLAKYPWTEWVDKINGASVDSADQLKYNDIQFDVLTGALKRKMATSNGKEDPVGKYVYDFSEIKVTDDTLSGQNYKIHIETSTTWDKTYIKDTTGNKTAQSGTYKLLSEYERYSNDSCTALDNVNGYYIKINGATCISISFAPKNRAKENGDVDSLIDFWYLGFYAIDGSEGREGQQKKWWTGNDAKADGQSNNTGLFSNHYDKLKLGKNNSNNNLTSSDGFIRIENWDLTVGRETYFEIVRKTIYLYAVDEKKTYGVADKYENFRVAICATNLGYIIDENGIRCAETASDFDSETNGLTAEHQSLFYSVIGQYKYMKQNEIKGAQGYAFIGTSTNSMKIYFKRDAGENAGIYSITACATQVGITDCSDPAQEEQSGTNRENIGDDYRIIEIAGTLTIETRKITIVPDGNQGFMYGNYTNEGSIPSITYKEYFEYVEGGENNKQGLVNSGNSDTNSSTATCLINVSGESVVCINDNQNSEVTITNYEYLYLDQYSTSSTRKNGYTASTIQGWTTVCTSEGSTEGCRFVNTNNVYKDYYSDPNNLSDRKESIGESGTSLSPSNDRRYALNRVCGTTTDLRYGRDVCNYEIVAGELDVGTRWERKEINRYVRMVFTNLYTKDADGNYNLYEGVTQEVDGVQKDHVKDFTNLNYTNLFLKVGDRYYSVTAEKRYSYAYEVATISNGASYVESNGVYYKITEEYRYNDSACTTALTTGNYLKTGAGCIAINDGTNTYKLSKTLKTQDNNGEFLLIQSNSNDNDSYAYNYIIEGFKEQVEYKVEEATLTVTPLDEQYKIYGEADPEIKFNVTTTYIVKSAHLIPYSNVLTINGNAPTNAQKYNANYTASDSGLYIMVEAGDVVILKGYAYMENMGTVATGDEELNYGVNYNSTKHGRQTENVLNSTSGAIHYDAYTTYNSEITVSRILIGNLYVEGHDQNVGVRRILNGFIVANNMLGNKNYLLPSANVNGGSTATGAGENVEGTIKFTIIPRPIYVEIAAITKEYGTATDILSCDENVTNCTANGLLAGQNYLAYNYVINETKNTRQTLPVTKLGQGNKVTNVYENINSSQINLPVAKSSIRSNYDGITTYEQNKFYTGTHVDEGEKQGGTTIAGTTEERNDLSIIVERGNYNSTRNTSTCFVNGEGYSKLTGKGCEDVGVYYTNFKGTQKEPFADGSYPKSVEEYYHSDYWGYNPNYYVLIENDVDTSIDANLNKTESDANSYHIMKETQKKGSKLTITKKSIEIVIETFSERNSRASENVGGLTYSGTLGEVYNIEQGTDVPELPVISNSADHTTYQNITWYMHPNQVRTRDNIFGYAAYYQQVIEKDSNMTIEETVQKYANIDYTKLVYHKNGDTSSSNYNDANAGPTVFDTSIAGYYAITRDIDELYIRYGEGYGQDMTRTTSSSPNSEYEANNYTTTFVNGILKIDNDRTAPVVFAGTEYYKIEANHGTTTNMDVLNEDEFYEYLNALKSNACKDYTAIQESDGNVNFNGCDSSLFATAIKVTNNKFKLNNYEWTISGNTITRSGGTTYQINANNEFTMVDLDSQSRTYTIAKDADGNPVLVLRKGTADSGNIEISTAAILMQWFNIRSHDPSIMRNGEPQAKRYNARYYFAIDENFNQRVVGDYTIYIYAVDNAGNISRATTVTLRVEDTTTPEVGSLNLYSGKVTCDYNSYDCQKEENWKVAETMWVPASAVNSYNYGFIEDKALYNYGSSTPSAQGEYYRIPAGADARAIKHLNWSNSKDGIYMTITENANNTNNVNYSKDNTINYLDIDGYVKLTQNGTSYVKGVSGTGGKYNSNSFILLGMVANVNNITHYYKQGNYYFPTDPTKESKTGLNGGYDAGTVFYVRLDGEYKQLSSLIRYKFDGNTYMVDAAGDFVFIGELKDISGLRMYNSSLRWDSNGTYIKLDQWDHYFSRDNGASWIKYDRETTEGYVALGEDGKRLIAIKVVDKGVKYEEQASTNTVEEGTTRDYFGESYYYDLPAHGSNEGSWYNPGSYKVHEDFMEYTSVIENYNVSDWSNAAGEDGYFRDRKYAYLDTQQPIITLDGAISEIYEYNCSNCTRGYEEKYGTTKDSYFVSVGRFKRYSDASATTRDDTNGAYIIVYVKNENRIDTKTVVEIKASKRLYNKSTTKTTAAACTASLDKWVNGSCYEQNDNGTYVYLGIQKDSSNTVDEKITGKISGKIGENISLSVFENNGTDTLQSVSETIDNANSNTEKTGVHTLYVIAGVAGPETEGTNSNIMAGVADTDKNIKNLDYKHKNVVIYMAESSPIAGLESVLYGDIFGTLKSSGMTKYSNTYYYKYLISASADNTWSIIGWYSTEGGEDNKFTTRIPDSNNAGGLLVMSGFTTLESAINKIITNNLENKNFAGKNLSFKINYTTMDMAGNVSEIVVRSIAMSDFLSTVVFSRGGYEGEDGTMQYLSSYSIDVAQNTNVLSVMGDFTITTNKTSYYDRYIVQTVYYNDKLVAYEQQYDANYLSTLDTTVPGVYKIIYNTKVIDGGKAVYSIPFELVVNVKSVVPNVSENAKVNIGQLGIAITACIATISIGVYMTLSKKRKKHN